MTDNPYIQYNSANIDYARQNRKKPTPAEEKIRQAILRKKRLGRKFTRQKPLGPFIADFYCASLMLMIEIDGDIHDGRDIEDSQRTDVINDLGIVVVRYTNDEVLSDIDNVRTILKARCDEREKEVQDFLP